jgi:GTP-binding protein HflX
LQPGVRAGLVDGNRRPAGLEGGAIAVSALSGEGIDALLSLFDIKLTADNIEIALTLDASDGEGLAWIYRHAEVVERRERAGKIALSLRIRPQEMGRMENRFPRKMKFKQPVVAGR